MSSDSSPLPPLPRGPQLRMGLAMPVRGAVDALRDSGLIGLAAAFGLVAVALLAVLVIADVLAASWLVSQVLTLDGFWAVLAWIALFVAGLPLVFVLFRALSKPLTWVFRRRLAARAERVFAPHAPTHELQGSWLSELAGALRGLPAGIALSFGILLLNIVPVIGQALAFGAVIWLTARGTARELVEAPMARRGFSERDVELELQRHRHLWLAAAASTAALSLVPLVNFVALPGAIVGASATWARLESEGHVPRAPHAPL